MPVQQLDRTVHTSSSGIEIIRTFYVEPYAYHPTVLKALQGYVEDGKRKPPSKDTYIPNCYCNECETNFADSASMASSRSMDSESDDLKEMLEDLKESPAQGAGGAIIKAHYRPLITAWKGEEGWEGHSKWDWLDPVFTPGVREIPWPPGLYIKAPAIPALVVGAGALGVIAGIEQAMSVPRVTSGPLGIPIHNLSIRRILLPEIPWEAIGAASNCVNRESWPTGGHTFLPVFPPGTLKFVGAKQLNRMDTEGNRWHEVELNFEWINLFAEKLIDKDGKEEEGWVTWNHVLHRPGRLGANRPLAWYEVYRNSGFNIKALKFNFDLPGFAPFAGKMHTEASFTPLFKLVP